MEKIAVYWSRRDFRLRDNPALSAACSFARSNTVPLLPIYILEDYMVKADAEFQFGYPSRWFVSYAVPAFAKQFPEFAIAQGTAVKTICTIGKQFAIELFVNEDVYPDFYTQIKKLTKAGVVVHIFKDQLTIDRHTKTGAGKTYSVFTPFKKAVWGAFVNTPETPYGEVAGVTFLPVKKLSQDIVTLPHDQAHLWSVCTHARLFKVDTDVISIDEAVTYTPELSSWYVSEQEALKVFGQFLKEDMTEYKNARDYLSLEGTSKMSLALAWGLVSARTLVAEMKNHFGEAFDNPFSSRVSEGALHFISELIWREFYKYLFFHNPQLMDVEFQERFRGTISWVSREEARQRFQAWMKGETGYKIVDAAMKELAHTGWMHNRARMIVASVLTKNLGVDWRWGQEYFRAMLIDLDEASNNGGWQWGASVGADPKPIRIFNPYLQAENYDKDGDYQKRWLGEEGYKAEIEPVVPHKEARSAALRRYGLSEKKDGFARDF